MLYYMENWKYTGYYWILLYITGNIVLYIFSTSNIVKLRSVLCDIISGTFSIAPKLHDFFFFFLVSIIFDK